MLPLVGRKDWGGSPHNMENWLDPPCPPTILTQIADCVTFMQFLGFYTLSPPPVDPMWETLTYEILKARQSKNYITAYNRVSTDLEKPTKSEKLVCFSKNQRKSRRLMKKLWILLAFRENSVNFE